MRSKVLSEGFWVELRENACFPLTCNVTINHKLRESRTEHEVGRLAASNGTTRWKELSCREESRSCRIDCEDGAAVLEAFAKRESDLSEVDKSFQVQRGLR